MFGFVQWTSAFFEKMFGFVQWTSAFFEKMFGFVQWTSDFSGENFGFVQWTSAFLGVSSYRGTNIENCTLLQKVHFRPEKGHYQIYMIAISAGKDTWHNTRMFDLTYTSQTIN
jgi:hypothetical protein